MNRRRIISAAVLFVFVVIALVTLNRVSFVTRTQTTPGGTITDFSLPKEYRLELFHPEKGTKRGEILAQSYTTLADGSVEARDISVDLAETEVGDVSLRSDLARLRLERIDEEFTGDLALSGNIQFNSVRGGEPYVSGRFREFTFDSTTNDMTAAGPFEISTSEGLSLRGVGLEGNSETMRFTVRESVRSDISPEKSTAAPGAEIPPPAVIEAGGPMTLDAREKKAEFSGGVAVTSGEMVLEGESLSLAFTAADADDTALPGEWQLADAEMSGGVKGRRGEFEVTGDRLHWQTARKTAGITGKPAVLSGLEGFIESPSMEVRFDEKDRVASVRAAGAGRALFSRAGGGEEDGEASAPEEFKMSWLESLLYDSETSALTVSGGVKVEGGDYRGEASRVTVTLEGTAEGEGGGEDTEGGGEEQKDDWFEKLAKDIAGFEAQGGVVFQDDVTTVRGERARYDKKEDRVMLDGSPATATAEDATFSSRTFTFDRKTKRLSAEGDCTVEIPIEQQAESSGPEGTAVFVRARGIEANLAGGELEAVCTGAVAVAWGRSALTCKTLTLSGARLRKRDEGPAAVAADEIEVTGEGEVVFERGEVTARCDRFAFKRGLGLLVLEPRPGGEVEITHGDTATFWSGRVTVDRTGGAVVCEKPRAVLFAAGSLIGFGEPAKKEEGKRAKTKVDLAAEGRLVLSETGEKTGLMVFDGGVKASRWDSRTPLEDMLESEALELDLVTVETAAGTGGESADVPKTNIAAARAKGSVYLRYAGADKVLEGRGDIFEWDKQTRLGRLKGQKASLWIEKEGSATGREFIYNFREGRIEARGVTSGSFILNRLPPK